MAPNSRATHPTAANATMAASSSGMAVVVVVVIVVVVIIVVVVQKGGDVVGRVDTVVVQEGSVQADGGVVHPKTWRGNRVILEERRKK